MAAPAVVRLAAAAYPMEVLPDWAALQAKLATWVAEAAEAGAEIAVFPEYGAMEAALVGDPDSATDWARAAAAAAPAYHDEIAGLAQRHNLTILSGSGPAWDGDRLVNRAWLCAPDGARQVVDKLCLTPWERANTGLTPGAEPVVCDTPWGRLAVLICYDCEFPALAQSMAADILLIPACTDAPTGQARLRIAAQARALEGQCVTVHAPLLGVVPSCAMIDTNTGCAGIYTPPDRGLPADGVLAQGAVDNPGWVIADAPLALIRQRRQDGEARLREDIARRNAP